MTLKNAASLALVGMLLLTILLVADFIKTVSGVLRHIIPAMALLRSLIYLFASLTVTVFFYVVSMIGCQKISCGTMATPSDRCCGGCKKPEWPTTN